MRTPPSFRSGCENVFLLEAVERKIHGCETKSERCRDEVKDLHSQKYNSYFIQGIYERLGCIFRGTISVGFWFSAFQSKTSE